MYYEDEFIDEVRRRNDIVDVISSYVNLKRNGSNHVGLCPFHNEKSASFSVSQNKQMYYCFGCHQGGNVITFLMQYENITFPEAIERLAEMAGMDLPTSSNAKADRKRRELKNSIYDAYKEAANFYFKKLISDEGKIGLDYFKNRQLTMEMIKHFGLGFSGKGGTDLYNHLKKNGFEDAVLKETGLFVYDEKKGVYDKFWNRVMFPIMDRSNRVIAFGGRVMGDGKPKYLNSPESSIFNKRKNLYAQNFIRGRLKDGLILCEGYMDVIALHQAGFTNAIATLGTAFTEQHAPLVRRYTDKVYLCYDSDTAGVDAALRAIPMLREEGITVKVINLEPYKDPDEFIKGLSKEEFLDRVVNARSSFFFEIDQLKKQYDMSDPESKTKFYNKVAEMILRFDTEIERGSYIEAFAREYGFSAKEVKQMVVKKSASLVGVDLQKKKERLNQSKKGQMNEEDGISKSEGLFITWLSNDVSLFEKTKNIISPDDFINEPYKSVAKMVYEQYATNGQVEPASIISKFMDSNEQSVVAGLFNKSIKAITTDSEQQKAIEEVVKKIKMASLELKISNVVDIGDLQKLIIEKKSLNSIRIEW